MTHFIDLRCGNQLMGLRIAESIFPSVKNKDDWMLYHLDRLKRMVDVMMFCKWFPLYLSPKEKAVFDDRLHRVVKSVSYEPPLPREGWSHFYSDPAAVDLDWKAVVGFENGAKKTGTLYEIRQDAGTWFAICLMASRELPHAAYA